MKYSVKANIGPIIIDMDEFILDEIITFFNGNYIEFLEK